MLVRPSLPLKLAVLFSFSLAGGTSSLSEIPLSFPGKPRLKFSFSCATKPKAEAEAEASFSDLLSLLGPHQQADAVNPLIAPQLLSCFKFISPFNQTFNTRSTNLNLSPDGGEEEIDDLILSPPTSVLELARLAVDSGADPGAIHRCLDPTIIQIPDIEGSNEHWCELTRTPYGRLFIDETVNSYIRFLFEIIVERGPSVGLNVALSRFDLFHGHLFIAKESGRLGILFHAREYPVYDKELFPYNMGYCQIGSNVAYDDSMNLRNILWLAPLPSNSADTWLAPGVLVVLDANPEGIIFRDLIPEYCQVARTLYEEYFGELVVDVNYLNVGGQLPKYKLFIC